MFILLMLMTLADGQQVAVYPKPFASLEECQANLVASAHALQKHQDDYAHAVFKCLAW